MSIQRSLIAFAAVFAASTSAGYAGPCSQDIARLQAAMDAKVRAAATAGPVAREGTAATMHRQPTPRSMATAESELGGLSPDQVKAARAAMARARAADSANDESACKQAIADAQGVLGQKLNPRKRLRRPFCRTDGANGVPVGNWALPS